MATPAQILTTVRSQIAEVEAGYFTDDEIRSYMWQGECELAKLLQCTETNSSTTSTVVGTREYAQPTNIINIYRVTWDSFPLTKINVNEVDIVEGAAYAYTGSQGSPLYYYEDRNYIGLSPIPNAIKTLKVYYTAEPAEITSSSTAFTIPAIFGFYLSDYCLYRMYIKDADAERARFHLDRWNEYLLKAQSEYKRQKRSNKRVIVKDSSILPETSLRIFVQ